MTWRLLGVERETGSGIEFDLPEEFTDETALGWFTPDRPLHGHLWKLSDEEVAAVARMLDTALETATTEYYIASGLSWRVDVFNKSDDQLAMVYRLPASFTLPDAARWTGARHLEAFGGEYELGEEQIAELGEIFDVRTDPERYAYFLGATGGST
jgi:hypothetical protein